MSNFVRIFSIVMIIISFSPTVIQGEEQQNLIVHFIDVGQGDSILLETPSGKNILIDGGPPEASNKVIKYLKARKVEKLDLLVATHPDMDHIGGLPKVMRTFDIEQVMDSGKLHTTNAYVKYMNEIKRQEISLRLAKVNESIEVDPLLDIHVLNSYGRYKNNNQSSIVLKVTYDQISFLLMADVERKQEQQMASDYYLEADIVKIAHHGSKTSSSLSFLEKVNPKIALITYSKDNDYGHPVKRVVDNLSLLDTHIYSTAVFGHIKIQTDGKTYFIFPEKSPIDGLVSEAS